MKMKEKEEVNPSSSPHSTQHLIVGGDLNINTVCEGICEDCNNAPNCTGQCSKFLKELARNGRLPGVTSCLHRRGDRVPCYPVIFRPH
jgi:hypothetical protein